MTQAQKDVLSSIIRFVLLLVFAPLTQHHVVDGPVMGVAINDLTAQILGYTVSGAVLAWSMLSQWFFAWRTRVALVMPPHATVEDLTVVTKATSPGSVPTPAKAAAIVATTGKP